MNRFAQKRGIYMVCLFLFVFIKINAQHPEFQTTLTAVYRTNIPFLPNPLRFSAALYNGSLFWIPSGTTTTKSDTFGKSVEAYVFDLINNKVDTIFLYLKHTDKSFRLSFQNRIGVNKDYIIISGTDKIRIFKKTSKTTYNEHSDIAILKFHLDDFFALNDTQFLCSSMRNFHADDDSAQFRMCIYNAKKKQIEKLYEKKKVNGIEFTQLPHQYLDYKNGFIAVADILDYKVWIFDSNLNIVDSIYRDNTVMTSFAGKHNISNTSNSLDELKIRDDTVSRIEKLYFLNDSSLMVSYKPAYKKHERTIDIWQRTQTGKWKNIVDEQLFSYLQKDDDTICYKKSVPNFTLSSPVLFTDTGIIQIAVAQDIPQRPTLRKEFKKMLESIYKDSPQKYDLCIYKWDLSAQDK